MNQSNPIRPRLARALLLCLTCLGAAALQPSAAAAEPGGAEAASLPLAGAPSGASSLEAAQPDGMGHLPGHASPPQEEDQDMPEACEAMMAAHGHGMAHADGEHEHCMAHADGHAGGHEHGHGHHGEAADMDPTLAAIGAPPPPAWLRGIELDAAQQDQLFDILHAVAPAQRKAQRTAERTHDQLHHIGMATDYSEPAVTVLADEHARAIRELTLLRARTERRILEVLTPTQRREAAHQAARDD